MDTKLSCPNCGTSIELTESLAQPLLTQMREDYEKKLSLKNQEILQQSKELQERASRLEESENNLEIKLSERLKTERETIIKQAEKRAKFEAQQKQEENQHELNSLKEIIQQRDEKLKEAQEQQLSFAKKSRELDDKIREQEIKVETELNRRAENLRKQAQEAAEENLNLKVAEKDEKITSLVRQIEDLKRRAEQGSQQLQGEAQEILLEQWLNEKFRLDMITPVAKGVHGGDILHTIYSDLGQEAGMIIWESKQTKSFQKGWLPKLRDDQRNAKADIAILVSSTLPQDITSFGQVDNIWVCSPKYTLPLAMALRQSLIDVHKAKASKQGQETKMEIIYTYLTGSEFKARIEAIVEHFEMMQKDLIQERKQMEKMWSRREKQISGILSATTGLWGDIEGIAGSALPQIESLELGGHLEDHSNE